MSGIGLDVVLAFVRFRGQVRRRMCASRRSGRSGAGTESIEDIVARTDVKGILDNLLDIWGFSICTAGTFNCDPHPGNVLLQSNGRLGLLDYGQVKTLPQQLRLNLCRWVLAVADGNQDATLRIMKSMQFKCTWANSNEGPCDTAMWTFASFLFGSSSKPPPSFELGALPTEDLVPVMRTVMLLRGTAMCMGYNIAVARMWKTWAQKGIADGT